jgi:hypothetical protein
MRDNPVKKRLLAGQPVFGTFGWEFIVPGLPQIVKWPTRSAWPTGARW